MSNAKLLDMASHVIIISGIYNTLLCSQTKNERNKYTYLSIYVTYFQYQMHLPMYIIKSKKFTLMDVYKVQLLPIQRDQMF